MEKEFILRQILEVAKQNDGQTPGMVQFEKATGIKETDWSGKHWARWGDAVQEAGLTQNTKQLAYKREVVIEKLISLIRELGKFPVLTEFKLKARQDKDFPAHTTFVNHLGNLSGIPAIIISYCEEKGEMADIILICEPHIKEVDRPPHDNEQDTNQVGYVYLLKSGKFYKIGMTNNPDRRKYEIGIQLPEELHHIHSIETDDPSGIEVYWHNRFKDKRQKGEWFDLNADDIRIFRRRKFM